MAKRRSKKPGPSHPHLKRPHMSTMGRSAFAPPGGGMPAFPQGGPAMAPPAGPPAPAAPDMSAGGAPPGALPGM